MGKIKEANKKIEEGVVSGYKAIENGVVSGYKKIENGVVSGYKRIEDKFVDAFLDDDPRGERHDEQQTSTSGKTEEAEGSGSK